MRVTNGEELDVCMCKRCFELPMCLIVDGRVFNIGGAHSSFPNGNSDAEINRYTCGQCQGTMDLWPYRRRPHCSLIRNAWRTPSRNRRSYWGSITSAYTG